MNLSKRMSFALRSISLAVFLLSFQIDLLAQEESHKVCPKDSISQKETKDLFEWCTHKVNKANENGLLNLKEEDFGVLGVRKCHECGLDLPIVLKKDRYLPYIDMTSPHSSGSGATTILTAPVCTHPQLCTGRVCNLIEGLITGIAAALISGSFNCLSGFSSDHDCTDQTGCTESFGCTGSNDCSQGEVCTNQQTCSSTTYCTDGIDCSTGNSCTAGEECTMGLKCSSSTEDCTEGPLCSKGIGCTGGHTCSMGSDCTSEGLCSKGEECTNGPMCSFHEDCTEGSVCSKGMNCTAGTICSHDEDCTNEGDCSTGENCTTGPICSETEECTDMNNCSSGKNCTDGPSCPQHDGCVYGIGNTGSDTDFKEGTISSYWNSMIRGFLKHRNDLQVILLVSLITVILPRFLKTIANRSRCSSLHGLKQELV